MDENTNHKKTNSILKAVLDDLKILTQSRYPFLFVVSLEEQRVIRAMESVAHYFGVQSFVWSSSRGLFKSDLDRKPVNKQQSFLDGLDDIYRYQGEAIFTVLDGSNLLASPEVARKLRDMMEDFEQQSKSIWFVDVQESIPPCLRRDFEVIQFPLPDVEELKTAVSDAEEGLPEKDQDQIARAVLGLTLQEANRAFRRSMAEDGILTVDDIGQIVMEKRRLIDRDGALVFHPANSSMTDVGGLLNIKKWIKMRDRAFSDEAREYGLPLPKGILLLGVQGCGKSLCCKAIAHEWKMPLLRLDLGAVYGSYVGMSEENIRNAIRMAETIAPCILWIDELEKGLAGLASSGATDAGTSSRVFSTVLTWMQEKEAPVFVTATANRLSGLPPELLRRGRFDEIFFVDLPNEEEKQAILSIHLRRHGRDPRAYDIDGLVKICDGYSGAEIEQALINALYSAFAEETELNNQHLQKALEEVVPLNRTMAEEIEELQRWAYGRARPASSSPQGE